MKHRIVTAAQMKEIERAGNAHGLPYLQMMENAGLAGAWPSCWPRATPKRPMP